MTVFCPRCRLPLSVTAPPTDRGQHVTCPGCLERISFVGGAAATAAAPMPVLPLGYQGPAGDVEAEIQTDLRFVVWGIGVFGVMALIGFLATRHLIGGGGTGAAGAQKAWLAWIAIATAVVAAVSFGSHFLRARRMRAGFSVRQRTTGERVAKVVVLGIGGLLLMVITAVAAIVLLFAVCLFGGFA